MIVLIAEDDRVYAQLLMRHLKTRGLDSTVAYDAMQATMMASRTLPAAILLDINMPGGTGLDVLKRLKYSSKTCMIPVIVISGSKDKNIPFTVKSLGADGFFAKPFEFEALYALLSQLINEVKPASQT
jgi:DNA-binding response OmpR family regulator